MGVIRIEDIRCFAYHGCMQEEGVVGTEFSVDIELNQDTLDKINLIHTNNPNPAP